MKAAHPAIRSSDISHLVRRVVMRVVVDKNKFPVDTGQRTFDLAQERDYIRLFAERWNDDRKFGSMYS